MNSKNSKAPMVSCNPPSGLSKDVSKTNYSTTTPLVNTIDPDGDGDARMKAMRLFLKKGYTNFQSPDWLVYNPEGKPETIEVKYKDLYEPPPFWGAGLDVKQVERRMRLLKDYGWRTYLTIFGKGANEGETYIAYLDELESKGAYDELENKGGYIDTPGGQRIYPLENYEAIYDVPNLRGLN